MAKGREGGVSIWKVRLVRSPWYQRTICQAGQTCELLPKLKGWGSQSPAPSIPLHVSSMTRVPEIPGVWQLVELVGARFAGSARSGESSVPGLSDTCHLFLKGHLLAAGSASGGAGASQTGFPMQSHSLAWGVCHVLVGCKTL